MIFFPSRIIESIHTCISETLSLDIFMLIYSDKFEWNFKNEISYPIALPIALFIIVRMIIANNKIQQQVRNFKRHS